MKFAKKSFSLIGAATKTSNGIGYKNTLPWSGTVEGKEDLNYFSKITTTLTTPTTSVPQRKNVVIMGKNTWMSIPKKYRPLPGRCNVVISKSLGTGVGKNSDGALIYNSLDNALNSVYNNNFHGTCKYTDEPIGSKIDKVFVIGGEQLYKEAIDRPDCKYVYLTEIDDTNSPYVCDTFFPKLPSYFKLQSETSGKTTDKLKFRVYKNLSDVTSEEYHYLNLLREIRNNGEVRGDRTGTGTVSLFGRQLRFNLKGGVLPLMTTKKTYYRGVVEELLFFLRGDHDNRKLQRQKVHIWDGNTSREYLDKYNKKHIEENDLGLAYGVQWRAAGAQLESIDTDYRGKGVDQLAEVIDLIKRDPQSRRIIINAWNVPQLNDMSLVPCHMIYQFYVSQTNKTLNCMMTQRSADMFLGVPFNIASTATLVHILAKIAGLTPGEIVINLGDAHIYSNHIDQVDTQLSRTPLHFPKLEITKQLDTIEDIENLEYSDFNVIDYYSHPGIKAKMAV